MEGGSFNVYSFGNEKNRFENKYKKSELFDLIFKLSVLLFLLLLIVFLIIISVLFANNILILVQNANELVEKKVPTQLDYVHKIISQNNDKVDKLEKKLSGDLSALSELLIVSNQFVSSYNKSFNNKDFIDSIKSIVNNVNYASSKDRLIKIETDLHIIAKALNKIAFNNKTDP